MLTNAQTGMYLKNLRLLVEITPLKAVMDVTEELFIQSEKPYDVLASFSFLCSYGLGTSRLYPRFQVGKQDTAL